VTGIRSQTFASKFTIKVFWHCARRLVGKATKNVGYSVITDNVIAFDGMEIYFNLKSLHLHNEASFTLKKNMNQ